MAKVYVVQDDGSKNFAPALALGSIEVLCIRDLPLFHDPTHELQHMARKLSAFLPEDHLLLTGDPCLIGAAMHYVAQINNGVVPALKWDKQQKTYFPIILNFNRTRGE